MAKGLQDIKRVWFFYCTEVTWLGQIGAISPPEIIGVTYLLQRCICVRILETHIESCQTYKKLHYEVSLKVKLLRNIFLKNVFQKCMFTFLQRDANYSRNSCFRRYSSSTVILRKNVINTLRIRFFLQFLKKKISAFQYKKFLTFFAKI